MKRFISAVYLTFALCAAASAQDMRQNSYYSLFADQKANKVGDAVTIIVVESSQASNNAETQTGRTSDLGFNGSITAGSNSTPEAKLGIGSKNDFSGSGSTKTTGLIRTKISATIDSVMSNGNLMIKGSRKIVINGEEQLITIKGIVRGSDIMSDNSVLSYNISEAVITFEGTGIINDSQKPGWLTKFFHWLF
ncbi:MAG: flagellar basal body L-ring protein FlgH [Ignavibacteria bacterium]|jgi:flagellar L-ring protein precursor FlgH|nr:flagellar basal body L-ring protein FlgH [Ignavibacteria bacterium]MCU7501925.1 flagellar basal body L-ring protein FlgH [Ignavibacteria bacterium]MCU7514729.1 flagellar basal body L-ring protein FlgH [Ignavibacteria bacterium]